MSVRDVHGGAWHGASANESFSAGGSVPDVQAGVKNVKRGRGGALCDSHCVVRWAWVGDIFVRPFEEDLSLRGVPGGALRILSRLANLWQRMAPPHSGWVAQNHQLR